MKKIVLVAMAGLAIFLFSCKKDSDKSGIDLKNPTYAKKTVAETQTDLENTGINMVTELKTLNQQKGVNATVNLLSLASSSNLKSGKLYQKSSAFKILSVIKNVKENNAGVNDLVKALENGDDISIMNEFNKISGVYTYNFDTEDFDSVLSSSAPSIKFVFPASKNSKESKINDGILEIYRPSVQNVTVTIDDQAIKELPSSIKFDIKVDKAVVLSYEFAGAYNNDGLPTSITSALTIGPFVMKIEWGYKTSDVSVNYSFKNDTKIIFDLGAAAKGNFDKSNIDSIQKNDSDPDKVLNSANAHFQFIDIKIAGQVDFKNLWQTTKDLSDSDADVAKEVEAINKYMDIVVVYASTNQAIAKGQAYTTEEEYIKDWVYNPVTYEYDPVKDTRLNVDFRMIFADDKPVDFDTYFNDGFDQLITEFNSFIDQLNTTYDMTINHVNKD